MLIEEGQGDGKASCFLKPMKKADCIKKTSKYTQETPQIME